MGQYRRYFVPGGTYFFTVRLRDQSSKLLVDRIDLLRHCVRLTQARHPFDIKSAVILPAKIHMIWALPVDDMDYSGRWKQIKSTFSRHLDQPASQTPSMRKRGEKGIWQPRFWEHLIRDQQDYDLHDHLIATAPLREGLVSQGTHWPYCSAYKRRPVQTVNGPHPSAA